MGRNRGLGVSLMATLDERALQRVPMLWSMIAIELTCGIDCPAQVLAEELSIGV